MYVSPPVIKEVDGELHEVYPQEARLRGLTYSAPIYVSVKCDQYQLTENRKLNPETDVPILKRDVPYQLLCYLPLMLKCQYCKLRGKTDRDLTQRGECVYDQGGYFVINGSEKVRHSGNLLELVAV